MAFSILHFLKAPLRAGLTRRWPIVVLAAAAAAPASAVVTLTFETEGSDTFVITLADAIDGASNGDFTDNTSVLQPFYQNRWREDDSGEPWLVTSVSGTPLVGTYSPADTASLLIFPDGEGGSTLSLALTARTDTPDALSIIHEGPVGFFFVEVIGLTAFANPSDYPGTYVEPGEYFSAYVGTYDNLGGSFTFYVNDAVYNITSLSIASTSAVPEPATTAALAGGAILALVVLKRRRTASAA
jgi:hypothetical protein